MSDEPVAKRTRLSVSRSRSQSVGKIESDSEKMQREMKELYKTMMSNCVEVFQMVPKVNRAIYAMKNPKIECQLREVQTYAKNVVGDMGCARLRLQNIDQIMYDMSMEKLHLDDCTESEECLLRMQKELVRDPFSLERKREILSENGLMISNVNYRQSPLHHAVIKRHVKCVKFLLERGADVGSMTTTQNNTVLHSLYSFCTEEEKRLEILQLLLKYGVSRIFQHNPKAGGYALRISSSLDSMDEVNLLLQHGATMTQQEVQNVVIETWKVCNLQMLKTILLECSKNLDLNAFSYDFCRHIIDVCYHKMILQGVPRNEWHEKLLEVMKFYRAFGGEFCVYPWDLPHQDLMEYFLHYKHKKYFKGAVKSRINALMWNPMSLKELSRLAVAICIRKDYHKNIKKLEVPEELQSFLRFDDVTITERPEKFLVPVNSDTSSSGSSDDDSDMEL